MTFGRRPRLWGRRPSPFGNEARDDGDELRSDQRRPAPRRGWWRRNQRSIAPALFLSARGAVLFGLRHLSRSSNPSTCRSMNGTGIGRGAIRRADQLRRTVLGRCVLRLSAQQPLVAGSVSAGDPRRSVFGAVPQSERLWAFGSTSRCSFSLSSSAKSSSGWCSHGSTTRLSAFSTTLRGGIGLEPINVLGDRALRDIRDHRSPGFGRRRPIA